MNERFLVRMLLFNIFCLCLIGCSQPSHESAEPTETVNLSPSITPSATRTPLPTNTSEPTSTLLPTQTNTPVPPKEVVIHEIPLAGPIAVPKAQISGMAWLGKTLIILPQYPEKEPALSSEPSLFILEKDDIIDFIEGRTKEPLIPVRIPFLGGALRSQIPGYEGYEAITSEGDKVYLTIEANDKGKMAGYLIEGIYNSEQRIVQIDQTSLTELPIPVQIFNYSYESLINFADSSLALYEANGVDLNPNPFAIRADNTSKTIEELKFNHIEYRITGATEVDDDGRFWVTNIFMPLEFWLYTESEPIFEKFGKGETHAESIHVERLLELQYNGDQISLTGTAPIQLQLDKELNPRNWEALVAMDDKGFLAMTDTYPDTILAFIPFPEN